MTPEAWKTLKQRVSKDLRSQRGGGGAYMSNERAMLNVDDWRLLDGVQGIELRQVH